PHLLEAENPLRALVVVTRPRAWLDLAHRIERNAALPRRLPKDHPERLPYFPDRVLRTPQVPPSALAESSLAGSFFVLGQVRAFSRHNPAGLDVSRRLFVRRQATGGGRRTAH